jgi:predicted outer membrane protein
MENIELKIALTLDTDTMTPEEMDAALEELARTCRSFDDKEATRTAAKRAEREALYATEQPEPEE